ncbi:branched-chain amino acid transport system II carrier protein [Utexia brackfieldae]|uniref:branched-chain amino acid transport system II carrier protein n=1 Tax=Utexia brackfieldae TaxID=3074108 RepID=UPI00370D7F3A
MKKLTIIDIFALGFMTFALFVGAGNIILPPFIGLHAGHNVWISALGFLITGVTLPVITIVAMARVGGLIGNLTSPIGKWGGIVLAVICYLSIGPLFANPRTAAVSFDVGIMPFLHAATEEGLRTLKSQMLFVYSLIFFVVVIAISFYPQKLLDSVGRILAPLKILSLLVLCFAAFYFPVGALMAPSPDFVNVGSAFSQGFVEGYLTLDTLASLAFALVIVNAIRLRGVTDTKLVTRYAITAGLISGVGLSIIYIGLFKLGSNSYLISNGVENGAGLLQAYVNHTFGIYGSVFLAVLIGIACLVTAIGITSACGSYFSNLLSVPYKLVVLVIAGASFLVSNIGLTHLLAITGPILMAIYPPCIALVLMSFFKKCWPQPSYVFVPVMLSALFFGIFDGLRAADLPIPDLISSLPLSADNLGWLIPSVVILIVASVINVFLPRTATEQA